MTLWRVVGSFYVVADTAAEAERTVRREVNSAVVQRLIEAVGDVDVHEGETEEWDVNG